jgi:hypothetical protein
VMRRTRENHDVSFGSRLLRERPSPFSMAPRSAVGLGATMQTAAGATLKSQGTYNSTQSGTLARHAWKSPLPVMVVPPTTMSVVSSSATTAHSLARMPPHMPPRMRPSPLCGGRAERERVELPTAGG